jgi:ELWxxDGT repeat protein
MKTLTIAITFFIFLLFGIKCSYAQTPYLVKDISPITKASYPEYLTLHGNSVFFFADDGIHGKELWKTDGTSAGTKLVKDINIGKEDGVNFFWVDFRFVSVGDILYFAATNGETENELWRTDGTEAGTYMVKDLGNSFSESPENLIDFNGTLFFTTQGSLWKSDGTEIGTEKVMSGVYASDFIVIDSTLYFTGYSSGGNELWKSDGTESGTVIVKKINPTAGSEPNQFIAYKDKLYFSANNGVGYNLWVSDGTDAGTKMVLDNDGDSILTSKKHSFSNNRFVVSNNLLFIASKDTNSNGTLWTIDGTPTGTKKIFTYKKSLCIDFSKLIDFNDTVYFFALGSVGGGSEDNIGLWKSDGTTQGTEFATKISLSDSYWEDDNILVVNNDLYLPESNLSVGYELFKLNGSTNQVELIKNIFPEYGGSGVGNYTSLNNQLIFTANNNEHGHEIWISDGTEVGTRLLADVNAIGDSYINQLTNVNGTLFFSASTVDYGSELWKSDGTSFGTSMVKDIAPHQKIGPQYLAELNNYIYFSMPNSKTTSALFRSDGTSSGTTVVMDEYVQGMVKAGNHLYGTYPGFWKSDGTGTGTVNIPSAASFQEIVEMNEVTYFTSRTGLYKINETNTGTETIMSFENINGLTSMNNALYFFARVRDSLYHYTSGFWKSDGTAGGTEMIKEVSGTELIIIGDTLFFNGEDENGAEIWKSDGTVDGTVLVKDINPNSNSSNPMKLAKFNDELYFVADDGIAGYELWRSNGTSSGTFMVKDINTGSENSFSSQVGSIPDFEVRDNWLFFTANDGDNGFELWKTDGTELATVLVGDIHTTGSSFPDELTFVNDVLFFTAYDTIRGRELWACNLAYEIISIEESECDFYTSPSGKVWTTSGIYNDTIYNVVGRDSIYIVNLTINSSSSSIIATVCESYTSPSGKVWTVSDTYTDTLSNAAGCDSVITIDLTINHSSSSSITTTACDSYISPSGKNWTVSDTYTDIIPNAVGCDSIITIDLTINHSSLSTITAVACNSYISPSGKVWTVSDIYTDTLPNAAGCDSIITIDLTINHSSSSSITTTACDSYVSPSGKVWTVSDIYTDTLPNAAGCDSVITIDLRIDCTNSISMNSILPVLVYPNPFKDYIIVDLDEVCDNLTVEVYDILGQMIAKKNYKNTKQVIHYIKGTHGSFILKLSDSKGKIRVVKLIKQ